ncbi:yjeF N-terminal domain-containing protein 3 isoform X1 [Equus asinus]|uniref:yjeF N-terminal domain-containing protein 3 isoform X1 n=1 Tax=Equus asinus TaxID=9793 RepID=UPI001D047114|nr:yjeF N-terminal domain-containing protein 3 isoform X1 [Equus asinus]
MSGAAGPDPEEAPEEQRFLSAAEAAALERELLEDYRFGRQQLVELCGHASAVAVTKVFPLPALSRKQRMVLVVCGPEQNGAVGLVCARHLRVFEYEPTIFYPTRSLDPLHRDLTTQCEKMDIPFLSYLPTEVSVPWQLGWEVGDGALRLPPDPACHPRLGRGDRRRRRGRAAAGRAGVAGGAQALRRPLLRAPPLRGRQVRARRRAPQVRAAPAGLHRHRLRGGALSPRPRGRTRANKQRSAATSPPRPLCAGPALGAQTRGGGSFPPAPGGPRRES